MDSEPEAPDALRTVIQPYLPGLGSIALLSGCAVLLWLTLAFAAHPIGGIAGWVILPISILGALASGWIFWWAARRRSRVEPALILDEVGIYDNVSLVQAGRVKWGEIEHVRVVGPRWLRILCIIPHDLESYLRQQQDLRRIAMWLSFEIAGAPVAIPMRILDIPVEDLLRRVTKVASQSKPPISPTTRGGGRVILS